MLRALLLCPLLTLVSTCARPPHPASAPLAPAISWTDNGELLVGQALRLEPGSGRWTALRMRHRTVLGPRVHLSGQPPAVTAIPDPAGKRLAWTDRGRVCVRDLGVDGYDCFSVPPDPAERARDVAERLRQALAGRQEIYWIGGQPPSCQRYSLAVTGQGYTLSLQRGAATVRHALELRGDTVALSGPVTERPGVVAAEGCLDTLAVGAIDASSIVVGGGRWFFDEAGCRAAATGGAPAFAPGCP